MDKAIVKPKKDNFLYCICFLQINKNICSSFWNWISSSLFPLVSLIYPSCFKKQDFTPFYSWMISWNVYISDQILFSPFFLGNAHRNGFYILAIVNWVIININVQISFLYVTFMSFVQIPRSGMAGPYGKSIFRTLRNLHTVFFNYCIDIYLYK